MGALMSVMDKITGGQISTTQDALKEYGEKLAKVEYDRETLLESLHDLSLQLEDRGWQKLDGTSSKQFAKKTIDQIALMSRIMWIKNPLIKRAVFTQTAYVFGQGLTVSAKDEEIQIVIKNFMEDHGNQQEFTSHQARMIKETELQISANIFFVFFVTKNTGHVRLRSIPDDEIVGIICNPDDHKEPWFYIREWQKINLDGTTSTQICAYPDFRYEPTGGTRSSIKYNGRNIEVVKHHVYHIKTNCLSDMDFGVSELYAACDWAKAYKEFLEDWNTIVKSISKYAWQIVAKQGKKGVDAAKRVFNSTVDVSNPIDRNLPPAAGSYLIHSEGYDISAINKTGATVAIDDSRRLLLMVSAATGIFEHYFGDPATGNLATATAMERPMELMFKDRQTLWADIIVDILHYVVDQNVMAPAGKLTGRKVKKEDGTECVEISNVKDRTITVQFPDILEKDVQTKVKAIVEAATLGGKGSAAGTLDLPMVTTLLLQALGVPDVKSIVDRLFPESQEWSWEDWKEYNMSQMLAAQQAMVAATGEPINTDGEDENEDEEDKKDTPKSTSNSNRPNTNSNNDDNVNDDNSNSDTENNSNVITSDESLNGTQISSFVDVIKAYAKGELTKKQAVGVLTISFSISTEVANEILGDEVPSAYKNRPITPDDVQESNKHTVNISTNHGEAEGDASDTSMVCKEDTISSNVSVTTGEVQAANTIYEAVTDSVPEVFLEAVRKIRKYGIQDD